ncbi:MAG: UTP--glucose-1-phosphate uridylyltransferase [Candidatus Caccovivens sp.]
MANEVKQCAILLAGKGTRFLPATKVMAKELFPIANKPALLYHLSEAYRSGMKKVCLVISKEKEYIKNFVSHDKILEQNLQKNGNLHLLDELNEIINNMQIDFVYQDKMSGTGGAVYALKDWAEEKPFALIFGDDLCREPKKSPPVVKQLAKVYEKTGKCVVGAKAMPIDVVSQYSSIITRRKLFKNCFEMEGILEKPKVPPSNLVELARFVLTPDIFDAILQCKPAKNGEIYLPDALTILAKQNRTVCYEFNATYYDCGNKLEYVKCIVDFALQDNDIADKLKAYLKEI